MVPIIALQTYSGTVGENKGKTPFLAGGNHPFLYRENTARYRENTFWGTVKTPSPLPLKHPKEYRVFTVLRYKKFPLSCRNFF
jgi:hypothetical protein